MVQATEATACGHVDNAGLPVRGVVCSCLYAVAEVTILPHTPTVLLCGIAHKVLVTGRNEQNKQMICLNGVLYH